MSNIPELTDLDDQVHTRYMRIATTMSIINHHTVSENLLHSFKRAFSACNSATGGSGAGGAGGAGGGSAATGAGAGAAAGGACSVFATACNTSGGITTCMIG